MDDPAPPSEDAGGLDEGEGGEGGSSDKEGGGEGVGPSEGSPPSSPGVTLAPSPAQQLSGSPPARPTSASPAPFRKFQSRRVLSYQAPPTLGGTPLTVSGVGEGSSVGLLASIKNRVMPESEELVTDLDPTQLAAIVNK
jgi:hypothetical protein